MRPDTVTRDSSTLDISVRQDPATSQGKRDISNTNIATSRSKVMWTDSFAEAMYNLMLTKEIFRDIEKILFPVLAALGIPGKQQ